MKTRSRGLLSAAALAALIATYSASAATHSTGHSPAPRFATPVVVDFFRPGFEPDLAIAGAGHYKGSTFVSMPNGFSTAVSYIWRSDDNRRSFHLAEGNALGKQETCVGGGDTELKVDPVNGNVYFADLQGLTNFSNSTSSDGGHSWQTGCTAVPGIGVDRQWLAIDSNGGTSAVGGGADAGRLYFDYDNVEQDVATGGNNQLVMNESVDGVHYGAGCQSAGLPCPLPPAVISGDEGIPGNVIVDNVRGSRFQHRVYAIHTDSASNAVLVASCSGKPGDHTAATVAADCTDPTQVNPSDPQRRNVNWHETAVRAPGSYETGQLFPSIASDANGNLYAAWSEYPTGKDSNGNIVPTGAGAIKLAVSRDGAQHWSRPITISPVSLKNDVMPWVVAGSPGRVGVAWYGSTTGKKDGQWGPDPVDNASWNLYYTMSTNALARHPRYALTKVSDHPVKYGDISTGGLGGTQDRSLGDFFQVQMGLHGEAVISYVDDTSADRNQDTCQGCGQTPPEAAGPVMVVTQDGGPSLLAGHRVPRGSNAFGSVRNSPGDAFLSLGGQDVKAPKALDVIGASVRQTDAKHLTISLTTNDRNLKNDLAVGPTLGGPVATWMVRWAAPSYGGAGDGNTFYVGMQSQGGSPPTFYTGSTQAIMTSHTKYFTYPATTPIPGQVKGATITWEVPLAAIGHPHRGDGLYSITAFTSTQLAPSAQQTLIVPQQGGEIGDENIPNLISAGTPFTYVVGQR